jgi:hypothetical protein
VNGPSLKGRSFSAASAKAVTDLLAPGRNVIAVQ